MKWRIRKSHLSGTIQASASKSHTIRALLIATLADGTSRIRNPLLKGDGESAIRIAQALGAGVLSTGEGLVVKGTGGRFTDGTADCDCGNSGTTMTLFTAAAALDSRPRRFDGDLSLRSRPMKPLLDAVREMGASYWFGGESGDVPFTVQGPLKGGSVRVNGINSQFVSSLLLSCPLAGSDTSLVVENLHEKPYVGITLWWLDKLGIRYTASEDMTRFAIPGGQSYRPVDVAVPGDFSSATFAAVGAAICGSRVTITGLDFSDPQGDKAVFEVLERFGVSCERTDSGVTVSAKGALNGCEIDLNGMPDALAALAVLGTVAKGITRLYNVPQARIKETDRIAVMTGELRKMGALITEEDNGLVVQQSPLSGAHVDGRHDHRVVMALALAAMVAQGETVIDTVESAAVTYPAFFDDFRSLGAEIETIDTF